MFWRDNDVTEEVKKWLQVNNSNWYKRRTRDIVSRWSKAAEIEEHYIESLGVW